MASTSRSGESSGSSAIIQVNESLYELNQRVGTPRIQVLFFHGLLLEGDYSNAYQMAWRSEDGSFWPQTWLVEELPGAHVFSVSCSGCLGKRSTERFDLFLQAENLISDILQANIGQEPHCPVVLVGHSIGGLVIKEVCCQAYRKVVTSEGIQKTRLTNFLNNLRGVFYYATPHRGSPVAEQLADIIGSPLSKYFKMLSTEAARLDYEFERMCKAYDKCQFANLGENLPTKLDLLGEVMVVPEGSARGANFNVDENADHFSICRPKDKVSRRFQKLKVFLVDIASEMKEQNRPDNFQCLPKAITGVGLQLQEVQSKLKDVKSLGLVGMGGLGKTTLAMALFNNLCLDFEYTSFVPRIKDSVGRVEKQVWNNLYHLGKKFGTGELDWSKLKHKRVLIVLDDLAGDCDVTSLLDGMSSESRLIVTSREQDLSSVDCVHEVQFLGKEHARCLFVRHAFPSREMAPAQLAGLGDDILRKCEGLPLTLEVLGQYLRQKQKVEDWQQTLNALEKAETVTRLDEKLWAKLKVSYDGLTEKEQKMFLDATTFFSGRVKWTLRDAKLAWSEAYDTGSVNLLWQTLVDMSLVYKTEEHKSIVAHEQLQSLGRRIAAEPNSGYRSRIWDEESIMERLGVEPQLYGVHEDVDKYLRDRALGVCPSRIHGSCPFRQKINEHKIEDSIMVGKPAKVKSFLRRGLELFLRDKGISQQTMSVKGISRQTMSVKGISEGYKSFLSALFPLEHFQLHSFFPTLASRLVFLRLNCSKMQSFPSSIGQLVSLRALHLHVDYGHDNTITHLDEIGELSGLQVLELDGFRRLVRFPETLGNLSKLTDLKLTSCTSLEALPESFQKLSMLQHLELTFCDNLLSLPDSFGRLPRLRHLELNFCSNLSCLPESFGQLSNLEHLQLQSCYKLHSLPVSFQNISMLRHLTLSFCGKLNQSREGYFGEKNYEFGKIERLPESLIGLKNLFHLEISALPLRTIPELTALQSLRYLTLGALPYLERLPPWLEGVVTLSGLSRKFVNLEKQGERFLLAQIKHFEVDSSELVTWVHGRAMEKVTASDYNGAVQELCGNFELLNVVDQGFLLQERGIAKRFAGDLFGAQEDLAAALKMEEDYFFSINFGDSFAHCCWRQLLYVNYLLGDRKHALLDREMTLERGPGGVAYRAVPCLGKESIKYLPFRRMDDYPSEDVIDDKDDEMTWKLFCLHSEVKKILKASRVAEALAIWNYVGREEGKEEGRYWEGFYLQERGILKRLAGDLNGSLDDLSDALDIIPDDYDCLKHRAYALYLLGNLEDAQVGARRCMDLKPGACTYDGEARGEGSQVRKDLQLTVIEIENINSLGPPFPLGRLGVAFMGFTLA